MKIYFIVVTAVLCVVVTFGFVLPLLFSAASTEAVIVGVVVLALAVPIGNRIFYRPLKKQMPPKENK